MFSKPTSSNIVLSVKACELKCCQMACFLLRFLTIAYLVLSELLRLNHASILYSYHYQHSLYTKKTCLSLIHLIHLCSAGGHDWSHWDSTVHQHSLYTEKLPFAYASLAVMIEAISLNFGQAHLTLALDASVAQLLPQSYFSSSIISQYVLNCDRVSAKCVAALRISHMIVPYVPCTVIYTLQSACNVTAFHLNPWGTIIDTVWTN